MAALVAVSAMSTLAEEIERLTELVWLAEIEAFNAARAASALADDVEIEFELAFMAPNAASTLDDAVESVLLEV